MSAATTMDAENDYSTLAQQLLDRRNPEVQEKPKDIREARREEREQEDEPRPSRSKSMVFRKGEQNYEIDEDAEIEFTADRGPVRLTLKEMRDRAAGDIAVKNRMHTLAEEKKKIQRTFKEFSEIAKDDPLGALEYISGKVKEADTAFEYKNYIEKLAEQAEKLGQMDEKERKALELEKKLGKAEQDLSLKEREANAVRRKQEILRDFPEIGDQEFSEMVNAVLDSDELSEDVESESDVLDRVEDLIVETLTQRDIITAINRISPNHAHDDELVFALSDQLRLNPDFTEEDIEDVIYEILRPSERDKAIRTLSEKNRHSRPVEQARMDNASDFDLLAQQLAERKESGRNKRR